MYQSTTEFGNVIQQDSRTFHALMVVDGKTNITTGIKRIKLNGGSNSESDFSIGSAVSQYIELELYNPEMALEGHELYLQIGVKVAENIEYIPMGYFTAEKPQTDESYVEVTAYDRMMNTERPCFLELPETTTTIAILNEIGVITGVAVVVSGLSAISMKRPDGYTCREVLSYIAQIYGGFAICNRQGQIEIRWYEDKTYKVTTGRYWDSFTHNDYSFALEKLTCYTGKDEEGNDISISVGSGIREISFSNPFMTQTMLNNVWNKLQNYTYMPGGFSFLGDPRIDPWDIVTVEDRNGNAYKVPVMKLTQHFDGGLTTEVESVGKSETEQSSGFKGPSAKNEDRWSIKLALIDQAIINKLDADVANVKFATIENLNAINAHVQNLDVDYGNFKGLTATELSATKANINILDADTANIKSLLAGNAGIGDLQNIHLTSKNAVIDSAVVRVALMDIAYVGQLVSGRISTDEVLISSKNGGIQIFGNVQQWKDGNGVIRMQAGQDANGEFNYYVTDSSGNVMWNALGLTGDAIKNPIITNGMVADDASIAGSKLDISSVVKEINNGSTTIKSTLIYLDDKKQTLDIAFSSLSSTVSSTNDRVTTIQSGLEGLKINMTELSSDLEGLADNTLLFNTQYNDNGDGTTTLTAKVYKNGQDVTIEYPYTWFTWRKKSEHGKWFIGQGYGITVKNEDSGLGGSSYIGRFATRKQSYLVTKSGKKILTKKNKYFLVEKEEK